MPAASAPRSRKEKPPAHHCGMSMTAHQSWCHGPQSPLLSTNCRSMQRTAEAQGRPILGNRAIARSSSEQVCRQKHMWAIGAHMEVVTELFEDTQGRAHEPCDGYTVRRQPGALQGSHIDAGCRCSACHEVLKLVTGPPQVVIQRALE